MDRLVSTDWLESHLGDADLRVVGPTVDIDVASGRIDSGRSRWEAGHVPGAVDVPALRLLDRDTGRHRPVVELRDLLAPALAAEPCCDPASITPPW